MPSQVAEGRFVQFGYAPDYLTGKCGRLLADGRIGPKMPEVRGCAKLEIVRDGGNVVAWWDRAIVTDKLSRENSGRSREAQVEDVGADLRLGELIVIPREPHDPIGHSDDITGWLGERTLQANTEPRVAKETYFTSGAGPRRAG